MTDIEVKGLSELQKLLDELPARIEANVVRGGLRAAARVIRDEARRLCPVGENLPKGHKSGALRDSIRVSMSSKHGAITASIKAGGKNNVYYAHMVEYGTAHHLIMGPCWSMTFTSAITPRVRGLIPAIPFWATSAPERSIPLPM
ncbi:MAG: hypothetical protein GJU73_06940 [Ferrovum sp.]|jgi:HK97 gp10 family phage protein|nr:hypothetical protein [Ferrovum sp.]